MPATPTHALHIVKPPRRTSLLALISYALASIATVVAGFEIVFTVFCMGEAYECAPQRASAIESGEVAALLIAIAVFVTIVERWSQRD